MRRVSGSSPLSSTIYPVVFRYQEQKPANFAGFLLFRCNFAHFCAENVPIFRAHFRAFLNERKRYLSAFRNCSPNSSIFLSFYIHILDIWASEIGFSLRFLKPFSFFQKVCWICCIDTQRFQLYDGTFFSNLSHFVGSAAFRRECSVVMTNQHPLLPCPGAS